MKNQKQNSTIFNSNKQKVKISSKNHLNTIEECPESDDIIKKLEAMNFTTDKSFETPFISLSKTRDKIINKIKDLNKSISFPEFYVENSAGKHSDLKSLKSEDINDSNYLEVISKFLNINKEKDEAKDNNNNGINKLVLNEKINRIYMLIQKCNLNKSCLDKMNKFMSLVNNISINLQPIDSLLEVIFELLSKIQEEYSIKNDLINYISIKKENYEKQIYSIKSELQNKEKQLEKLMNIETMGNLQNKIENNNQLAIVTLLNNVKKDNQILFEQIVDYKSQIQNLLTGCKILYEKHQICLAENEKLKSKSMNNFSKVAVNNIEIKGKTTIQKSKSSVSFRNIRMNTEYNNNENISNLVNSLTNNLIKLLLDINQMLFKYDYNLHKINKNNRIPLNNINEIIPNIDINFLIKEKNFQLFSKYISCNLDIINNKIINLSNSLSINSNRFNKENKNSSMTLKNSNELLKNSSIKSINQSVKFFSPENKSGSKTMKNYINLRRTRNAIRNQKLVRNSTSKDGVSFINFYKNNDLDNFSVSKKNSPNKKINKLFNQTVNIEKQRNKKQNSSKLY